MFFSNMEALNYMGLCSPVGCVVAERTEAVWLCYNWTGREADLDLHQAVLRQWGSGWVGAVRGSLPGLSVGR